MLAAFGPWMASWAYSSLRFTGCTRGVFSVIQAKSFSRLLALTQMRTCSGEKRYATTSSTNPPWWLRRPAYTACPSAALPRSLVMSAFALSSAPSPRNSISPMCETSNIPAAFRTASCSATTPVYWTGMSQPAKSTIRAPSAR